MRETSLIGLRACAGNAAREDEDGARPARKISKAAQRPQAVLVGSENKRGTASVSNERTQDQRRRQFFQDFNKQNERRRRQYRRLAIGRSTRSRLPWSCAQRARGGVEPFDKRASPASIGCTPAAAKRAA
ncbi:MAG: hypothetical protein R3C16_02505 [Hyphomonadaceae bacterium]